MLTSLYSCFYFYFFCLNILVIYVGLVITLKLLSNCCWLELGRNKIEQITTKMDLKNMVALVSRTGRQMQRYNFHGDRQVVGCIPYRYKGTCGASPSPVDEEEIEVLVITSQRKGKGVLFPKGGWENDESIEDAALRETVEEAGVLGDVEHKLGKWNFKNKSNDTGYEGHMFPLLVKEQLDFWPEKDVRQRLWISVREARKVCQYWWMKEALELLVNRLTTQANDDSVSRKSNL